MKIHEPINYYLINQAKQFLYEFGEFYPYGAGTSDKGEVIPIGIYFGQEYPAATQVIDELEIALRKELNEGRLVNVAVCTDVLVNAPHLTKKMDAIQIRCQSIDGSSVNIYMPYYREEDNSFVFLDAYEEKGTLDLI